MDEILRLHDEPDTFTLLLPYSVKAEIEHPSTPPDKKRLAENFVFSMEVQLTESELALHERVRAVIQGNAKPGRHHKDAFHLVESAKYDRHFITKDARLLKKASDSGNCYTSECSGRASSWLRYYASVERDPR